MLTNKIFKAMAFTLAGLLLSVNLMAWIKVNVTVPQGTPACYFYGQMSDNAFVEMTKVDDTHYTYEFPHSTEIGWGYKFCYESGNWNTENGNPSGDIKVEPDEATDVITVEVIAWKTDPPTPAVGDQFVDAASGLKFEVTATGTSKTVKVIKNTPAYTGSSYTIPASVTYNNVEFAVTGIGESVFTDLATLTSITLPEGLETIESWAFSGTGLTAVTIPASVGSIGEYAFWGCTAMFDVYVNWTAATKLPALGNNDLFDKIAGGADSEGPKYATLHVPAGTKAIYEAANVWKTFGTIDDSAPAPGSKFVDATSGLKFEITASGENNTAKVIANSYTGTSYTIPASITYNDKVFAVTEIGKDAFKDNGTLTSIELPDGLKVIGEGAFAGNSKLAAIDIPVSVTSIGGRAFYQSQSIADFTFHWTAANQLPKMGDDVFSGISSGNLHIPVDKQSVYNGGVWNSFNKVDDVPVIPSGE